MPDMMRLTRGEGKTAQTRQGKPEAAVKALWDPIDVKDTSIISRCLPVRLHPPSCVSPERLVFRSRSPSLRSFLRTEGTDDRQFTINAVAPEGTVWANGSVEEEISRRVDGAWVCYGRNGKSVGVRRELPIEKRELVKAEVIETLLFGCTT